MPNGFGRGCGFRDWSPPSPFVGWGRGGLHRCWSYSGAPFFHYPASPEQERDMLRNQAQTLRQWIDEIEQRVKDLEAKE